MTTTQPWVCVRHDPATKIDERIRGISTAIRNNTTMLASGLISAKRKKRLEKVQDNLRNVLAGLVAWRDRVQGTTELSQGGSTT